MGKKIKKADQKRKISLKNYKILSQSANKAFNFNKYELELDDTESRNQIIKDLKILASK
jgi:ribonuclease R